MTGSETIVAPAAIWESYTSSWKAETDSERRALFARSLAPECSYTDPLITTEGWDALTDYMHDFHQQVPGGHFRTTWFNAHSGASAARWDMVTGDGIKIGEGISFARYRDDGLLVAMTGFFETDSADEGGQDGQNGGE